MTMDGLYHQQHQIEDVCAAGQGRGQRSNAKLPRIPNMAYLYVQESTTTRRGRGRGRMLRDKQRAVSPIPAPLPKAELVQHPKSRLEDWSVPQPCDGDRNMWRESDFPLLGTDNVQVESSAATGYHTPANSYTESSAENRLGDVTGSVITHSEATNSGDNVPGLNDGMNIPLQTDSDNFIMPKYKANIVKPKSSVNKFNFAAVNQGLLDDISALPIKVKQKPPKILSLTKENLDKYLNSNQSDTLALNNTTKSHMRTSMDMRKFVLDEEGPCLDEYQVTHDEKQVKNTIAVPANVKGRLNLLKERIDNYINEKFADADDVGNMNNNAKKGDDGSNQDSSQFSTNNVDDFNVSGKHEEQCKGDNFCANAADVDVVDVNYGCCATAEGGDVADNCDCTNDSVISNMSDSDFNVSSEEDFITGDLDEKYMKEFEKVRPESIIDHTVATASNEQIEFQDKENEQCAVDVENKEVLRPEIKTLSEESSDDPTLSVTHEVEPVVNAEITMPVSDSSDDSESKMVENSTEQGQKAAVDEPPSLTLQDLEGFMLVKGKHSKKKKLKPVKRANDKYKKYTDNSVWRLYGKCVIQVDGLPQDCDITALHEAVSGFGRIVDHQSRQIDMGCSVRFKLCNVDACDYAIQCLHNTECLYPDSNRKMECYTPPIFQQR